MSGERGVTDLGSLVIANGQTASSSLDFRSWRGSARTIGIQGPGTLTGSVKVQVSADDSTYVDLQANGANIAVTATGETVIDCGSVWKYLRVLSGSAEGGARTFLVTGY